MCQRVNWLFYGLDLIWFYNDPMRWPYYSHFTDEESEAQNGCRLAQVTTWVWFKSLCPWPLIYNAFSWAISNKENDNLTTFLEEYIIFIVHWSLLMLNVIPWKFDDYQLYRQTIYLISVKQKVETQGLIAGILSRSPKLNGTQSKHSETSEVTSKLLVQGEGA